MHIVMSCYFTCLGLGKNLTVGKLMHIAMSCYLTYLGLGENQTVGKLMHIVMSCCSTCLGQDKFFSLNMLRFFGLVTLLHIFCNLWLP